MRFHATVALVLAGIALTGAARPAAEVRRCGWIVNPTPGNWWLVDRAGEWTLATQGGHQARGMDDLPDLTVRDWVADTPAGYGHGCACMTVRAAPRSREVTSFTRFRQRPIAACRADRRLPRP